jgi:hypothetical protein
MLLFLSVWLFLSAAAVVSPALQDGRTSHYVAEMSTGRHRKLARSLQGVYECRDVSDVKRLVPVARYAVRTSKRIVQNAKGGDTRLAD